MDHYYARNDDIRILEIRTFFSTVFQARYKLFNIKEKMGRNRKEKWKKRVEKARGVKAL